MKRTLLVLLGWLLLVVPAAVQAQFGYITNTDGATLTITNYTGTNTVVIIPTNIGGLTVTGIGTNAFVSDSLTSVTIPDSITTIDSFAFRSNTNLTSVTIPGSVTNIGAAPFVQCSALTSITVETGNPDYSSVNGVLFGQGLTTVIQYPGGLGGSYTIPNNVTSIGQYAFSYCPGMSSVTIPGSVTNIAILAFADSGLTNACFEGNASTNFKADAFMGDSLTNVFYVSGATGWGPTYANTPTNLPFIPTTPCTQCAGAALGAVGSLQVSITPSNAVSAGAEWQIDGGLGEQSGVTVPNIPAGTHTVSFTPIFGWSTPADQIVTITSNGITTATGVYTNTETSGALTVVLLPSAISSNVQWQVTGTNQNNVVTMTNLASGATVTNLAAGDYTVSFTSISNWITPSNQPVTITAGVTTTASGIYTQTNAAGLVLLTNGYGTIALKIGKTTYKVTATPKAKNIFTGWVGGTSQPYSVLSLLTSYTFTNQLNLVLEGNFETNVFLAAQGPYRGLFAPTNSAREQTNSGSFLFNVTSGGAVSGSLNLGGQAVPFSGKFNPEGAVEFPSKMTRNGSTPIIFLQLDFAGQSVSGIVSNTAYTAVLNGDRAVFSHSDPATKFAGQYTLVIPGVSGSTNGPFGDSYGTVKVSASGAVTLAGSLADGTAISQSSVISQDGYWPLYVSLYGGKGSLWGWNNFAGQTLEAAPVLSWINATNSSKTAVYRSGFTNQQATLTGGLYTSAPLPSGLTVTLQETNPPFTISLTNLTGNTNKLTLKTNKTTGVISGAFAYPGNPKATIKVNGVILQGQTNAEGYFLGTNQSGAFKEE